MFYIHPLLLAFAKYKLYCLFACAFQSLRSVDLGFRHTGLDWSLGYELVRRPMGSFPGSPLYAQPGSTSLYPEKTIFKRCALWPITLGLKRLFLIITPKFSFEASAPTCPDTCNANNNRQCLVNKDNTGVECVCLSGYKEDDHGICQK